MSARFGREIPYLIEINDHEFRKLRQGKRIERLLAGNAREIAQAQRTQLELFSLFRGRQKKISHSLIITPCSPCLRDDSLCFVISHHGDTEDTETSRVFAPMFD